MVYVMFLLIPLGLGGVSLVGGVTTELVLVVSLSWLLSVLGLWKRRFGPVVAAGLLLLVAYMTQVFSAQQANLFWRSAGFGVGLFAMFELGQDCTSVTHGKLTLRSYLLRARYIAVIAAVDLAAVFVLATISYNLALQFPDLPFTVLVLPALFVIIGGAGYLLYRRVKTADEGTEKREGAT